MNEYPEYPCEYGHFDCSYSEGGECSDEHREYDEDFEEMLDYGGES